MIWKTVCPCIHTTSDSIKTTSNSTKEKGWRCSPNRLRVESVYFMHVGSQAELAIVMKSCLPPSLLAMIDDGTWPGSGLMVLGNPDGKPSAAEVAQNHCFLKPLVMTYPTKALKPIQNSYSVHPSIWWFHFSVSISMFWLVHILTDGVQLSLEVSKGAMYFKRSFRFLFIVPEGTERILLDWCISLFRSSPQQTVV